MSSLFYKKSKKSSLKANSNLNDSLFSLSVSSFDLIENCNANNTTTKSKFKKLFLPRTTSIQKKEFPLHKSVSCKNIASNNSKSTQIHRLSTININIDDNNSNYRYASII